MIIGSPYKREIGEIGLVHASRNGPSAMAKIIREATYDEWLANVREMDLTCEIHPTYSYQKDFFYEVSVD